MEKQDMRQRPPIRKKGHMQRHTSHELACSFRHFSTCRVQSTWHDARQLLKRQRYCQLAISISHDSSRL